MTSVASDRERARAAAEAWVNSHGLRMPSEAEMKEVNDVLAGMRLAVRNAACACAPGPPRCSECPTLKFTTETLPQARVRLRDIFGVRRVPVPAGVESDELPFFEMDLEDGTQGYFQRRSDDCMQVAIATVLQISPWCVPDLRLIDRSIDGEGEDALRDANVLVQWLAGLGLRMEYRPPMACVGRWIGIKNANGGPFRSHCLILRDRKVMFDPLWLVPTNKTDSTIDDVDVGIELALLK